VFLDPSVLRREESVAMICLLDGLYRSARKDEHMRFP
jgi:hypothetical protein